MFLKKLLLFIAMSNLIVALSITPSLPLSQQQKVYFGEQLFNGNFKNNAQFKKNPNYQLKYGDIISLKIWGAYEFIGDIPLDSKGNIFIPQVGAINLLGLQSQALQVTLNNAIKKVFNDNVQLYATIKEHHPIFVFVSGSVNNIGLYDGFSEDSILQFLDKANGIIKGEGSYRQISVMRNNRVIKNFDLYNFLINGIKSSFKFKNGDVILVKPMKNFVEVSGAVTRPYIFEFYSKNNSVKNIIKYTLPKNNVNQFIHTYKNGKKEIKKTYQLSNAKNVFLNRGDKINFFSNQYQVSISISIEGEHKGARYVSILKGTSLYDILKNVQFSPLSNIKNIQFFRKSIAIIEKKLLDKKLQDLEERVLVNGSSTSEEAIIRSKEVTFVMKFIQKAKQIEPNGQLLLTEEEDLRRIILKENDRIFIPQKSNVVVTQGEINIPNASTFKKGENLNYYIESCGGFTSRANKEKILIIKANGKVISYKNSFFSSSIEIEAGDSILVLGKSDTKNLILAKDITQIIYQIAVGAAVILKAF